MGSLYQSPTSITLQEGPRVYTDTPENFSKDSGVRLPPLPTGVTLRQYTPELVHSLRTAVDTTGAELNWAIGDLAIDALDKAVAAQATRRERAAEVPHIAAAVQDSKAAAEQYHEQLKKDEADRLAKYTATLKAEGDERRKAMEQQHRETEALNKKIRAAAK